MTSFKVNIFRIGTSALLGMFAGTTIGSYLNNPLWVLIGAILFGGINCFFEYQSQKRAFNQKRV